MKKVIFILIVAAFLLPAQLRAQEAATAVGTIGAAGVKSDPTGTQAAGESKVVVEIARSQWCQCVRAILKVEGGDISGCVKSGASEEKLKIFRQRGEGSGNSSTVKALLSFAGCSESENENVGSLSFNVQWQGRPAGPPVQGAATSAGPISCEAGGISSVEIRLFRSTGEKLASAGPWNCANPVGTLNSIPVGSNLGLVVTGKNAAGELVYRGEQDGIAIAYKQTTALGAVAAAPFTPVLTAPENAAVLGSGRVGFRWTGPAGAASYQVQVSENENFTPTIIDTPASSTSYETTADLASRVYFWRVKAKDVFNNNGAWSSPGSVTVDAEPPINTTGAKFINKGSGATNVRTVSLAISAVKKAGVTGYYISEQQKRPSAGKNGWVAIPSSPSYADVVPYTLSKGDGEKTISVWFKDAFGHVSKVKSESILFDTKLPHATITSHPSLTTNSPSASFSFTSTKPRSTFQCLLDEGAYSACTGTALYGGLHDGPHTFTVKASDAAGNTDPNPDSFTWVIDTAPPHTSITSQPPVSTNSDSASFEFTSSKTGSTFSCRLDGNASAACVSPLEYTGLAAGPHTFMVRATDSVGNTDPSPPQFTWTVAAPFKTTITEHPSDPSDSKDASFSFATTRGNPTFQCQLDNGTYSACTSPQTYAGLSEDSHTFSVKAVGADGNEDPVPARYTWVVSVPRAETTEVNISEALNALPFPESPELTMLGVTPDIIRPAAPREVALSFAEGIDVSGNPQTALAVDMSPYLLLYGKGLSLRQYQDSKRKRDLSRVQLSLVYAKAVGDDDPARRMGAAIHWTIWDDGDLRLDKDLVACLEGAESGVMPEFAPAPESRKQGAGQSEAKQPDYFEAVAAKCRADSLKRNWNKSAMDVGFAPNWIDRRGGGDSFGWDGLGLWTSWSHGFDNACFQENSQIILHARYRTDEAVPTDNRLVPYSDRDSLSFGAKYRCGNPKRIVFFQGLFEEIKPHGQAAGHSYIFSVGTEVALGGNLWIDFELGEISGYRSQDNAAFFTGQIKGAFPEDKATK